MVLYKPINIYLCRGLIVTNVNCGKRRLELKSSLKGGWWNSNLQWEVCCLKRGKVKHQRVLRLTPLTSTLLLINFVLKLNVLLTI